MAIKAVIFDLGGVLVDWNPAYVFHDEYFKSPAERDYFFSTICTSDWNENQDAGYSIEKATEEKVAEFPEWEKPIRDFYGRWEEMLGGPLHDTVALFKQLKEKCKDLKFYALTNWSAETFPVALKRFDFLHWFDGRVVSGEEKTRKPFPEFYQRLLDRYGLEPGETLFIDDNLRNIKAAAALGMNTIFFENPGQLSEKIKQFRLI
jgi:2-haloacid dehalogenase